MNILVFFAHPDDETMLCGGTLALLAQAGAKIHFVCATRGEGGEAARDFAEGDAGRLVVEEGGGEEVRGVAVV